MTDDFQQWHLVERFALDTDLGPVVGFLRDQGVPHRVSEAAGMQELHVKDAAAVAPVRNFIEAFARGDIAPSALKVKAPVNAPQGPSLALQLRLFPVTLATLALCIGSFAAMAWWPGWMASLTFTPFTGRGYGPLELTLASGEYWRLISPIFLHFGVLHLVFNGVLLWWLGQRLEFALGHGRFALLLVLSALGANYAQYAWTGSANFGGISGAIYGFVGYILVLERIAPINLFKGINAMLWFMVAWLILCMTGIVDFFMSGGGVANAAHLGGLVVGLLLAFILKPLPRAYG